jgi:hypothetical protein
MAEYDGVRTVLSKPDTYIPDATGKNGDASVHRQALATVQDTSFRQYRR